MHQAFGYYLDAIGAISSDLFRWAGRGGARAGSTRYPVPARKAAVSVLWDTRQPFRACALEAAPQPLSGRLAAARGWDEPSDFADSIGRHAGIDRFVTVGCDEVRLVPNSDVPAGIADRPIERPPGRKMRAVGGPGIGLEMIQDLLLSTRRLPAFGSGDRHDALEQLVSPIIRHHFAGGIVQSTAMKRRAREERSG